MVYRTGIETAAAILNEDDTPDDPAWIAAVAEASAWIALLHGPRRTAAAERGFQHWLNESPLHQQAFELATDTWNEHRALIRRGADVKVTLPGEREEQALRTRWYRPAAAVVALLVVALVALGPRAYQHFQPATYATRANEQRTVLLKDGTLVSLNDASTIVVDYSNRERLIHLTTGDAVFYVSKQPDRPFVVIAGDRKVTALGTSFYVALSGQSVSVALLEGKVNVAPASKGSPTQVQQLSPGERLTFKEGQAPIRDRPPLDQLIGPHGMVSMDKMTLADAMNEMNRYSTVHLSVESESDATIPISGIFRIGDSPRFANAVARQHGFEIKKLDGNRLVFVRAQKKQQTALPDAPASDR